MEADEETCTAFVLVPTPSVSAEIRAWVGRNVHTKEPKPVMYVARIGADTPQDALEYAAEMAAMIWGPDLGLMMERGDADEVTVGTLMDAGLVTPGRDVELYRLGFSRVIKGRRVLVVDLGNCLNRMWGEDLWFTPNTRAAIVFGRNDKRPTTHDAPRRELSPEEQEHEDKLRAILRQMFPPEADEAGEMDAGDLPF